jgi:hypothetical protein
MSHFPRAPHALSVRQRGHGGELLEASPSGVSPGHLQVLPPSQGAVCGDLVPVTCGQVARWRPMSPKSGTSHWTAKPVVARWPTIYAGSRATPLGLASSVASSRGHFGAGPPLQTPSSSRSTSSGSPRSVRHG